MHTCGRKGKTREQEEKKEQYVLLQSQQREGGGVTELHTRGNVCWPGPRRKSVKAHQVLPLPHSLEGNLENVVFMFFWLQENNHKVYSNTLCDMKWNNTVKIQYAFPLLIPASTALIENLVTLSLVQWKDSGQGSWTWISARLRQAHTVWLRRHLGGSPPCSTHWVIWGWEGTLLY